MANNINKTLGFSFYINIPEETTVVPEEQSFVNEFDLIGDMVSLKRINGESNVSYKARILDVSVHPGGPTYPGVINSLTRDLDLLRGSALTISLKTSSAGDPLARNPRVDILPNKVVLYSDWRPDANTETIDKTIRIYQPTDDGYFLSDLITEINSSTCFSATIASGVRTNLHSTNLIRANSNAVIQDNLVPSSNKFSLVGTYIVEDSLVFDEEDIFLTEVTTTPSAAGEYKVNRTTGEIEVYSLPSGNYGVSYYYGDFPFEVDYSMVKIYTLQEDDFLYELFEQETIESGEEINTLPNDEGAEIIHQLFTDLKTFWGS